MRFNRTEIPPCELAQLLPSLDKSVRLRQVSLTRLKHAVARNVQDQILSKAYGQWEIFNKIKLKSGPMKENKA